MNDESETPETAAKSYIVYADLSYNSISKKVRNEQMYIVSLDGELEADICGGLIGIYEGRLSRKLLKVYAKCFAESSLEEFTGQAVEIPLANVVLMDSYEIKRIPDRVKSPIHQALKDLR